MTKKQLAENWQDEMDVLIKKIESSLINLNDNIYETDPITVKYQGMLLGIMRCYTDLTGKQYEPFFDAFGPKRR